jgi:hypothetical protein
VESLGRRLQSKAALSITKFLALWQTMVNEVIRESSEEAFALHSRGLRYLVVRAFRQPAFKGVGIVFVFHSRVKDSWW